MEMDNDLLLSSDDAYTGGVSLTYMGNTLQEHNDTNYQIYTDVMRNIFSVLSFDNFATRQINTSISIQQVQITPKDINETKPIYDDNPYAGILMTHFSLFAWNDDFFDQYRISLGVIGKSSYAKEIQETVHQITGSENPRGWDNQISQRFSIGLGLLRGMRNYELQFGNGYSFEWFNSVYADIGNSFIGGGAGTLVRYGRNVPRNFDVPSVLFSNSPNQVLNIHERVNDFGWSVDAGTSINAIGYYYLYEEAEDAGYDFYSPSWMLTSKIGVNLYVENFNFSLSFFPVITRKNTTQSASWGRFSFGWHY